MLIRLMEGHTAPGTLLQVPPLVLDVVHLGEDGPGVGGDQTGAPDEENDPLGSAHTGPGGEGQGVADGLVPEVMDCHIWSLYILRLHSSFIHSFSYSSYQGWNKNANEKLPPNTP